MGTRIARDSVEIDEQLNDALDVIDTGRSRFPGMSYEQGVEAALRWVTGDSDDEPMPEE